MNYRQAKQAGVERKKLKKQKERVRAECFPCRSSGHWTQETYHIKDKMLTAQILVDAG